MPRGRPTDIEVDLICVQALKDQLNREQKHIFDEVCTMLNDEGISVKAVFIDGPGGSGKTFLYKTLTHYIRGIGETEITVAWTGIASILLPGGRTAHTVFKFPLPLTESSVSLVKPNTKAGQALNAAKAIIWDEASMIPGRALLCSDRLLRDIHQNETPFGGKIIILGGDFRQVLPVIPRSTRTGIVGNCLARCSLWKFFKSFKLTINMHSQERDYCNFLLRIGHGEGQDEVIKKKITDLTEKNFKNDIYISSCILHIYK